MFMISMVGTNIVAMLMQCWMPTAFLPRVSLQQSTGACCFSGCTPCQDGLTYQQCSSAGGSWNMGHSCSSACPYGIPEAKCCVNGACTTTLYCECSGVWQNEGCGAGCQILGACCAYGNCYDGALAGACQSMFGTFYPGATCGSVQCGSLGACCSGGSCTDGVAYSQCSSGVWFNGRTCAPGLCYEPVTGACCTTGGCYDDVEEYNCTGGVFHPGSSCSPGVCDTPVKKLTWGLLKSRHS